jgi:hypothetical protein
MTAQRLDALGEAAQARAGAGVRSAGAVVGDVDEQPLARVYTRAIALVACACLATLVSASETR